MLLLACERLGVEPARALMVGDSRFDREAAAAAGIRFIGFGIDGDLRIEALRELLQLPEVATGASSWPARSQEQQAAKAATRSRTSKASMEPREIDRIESQRACSG